MRAAISVALSTLLALSPLQLGAVPSTGLVQGTVTVDGRPLSGMDLALVDLSTGRIHRARSDGSGAFQLRLSPGRYVVTNRSRGGIAVGRAPAVLAVEAGKVASARIDLVALSVPLSPQPPAPQPSPGAGPAINVAPVDCLVAGEHPIIDADIQPAASVARARLYFRSALSDDWFYGEAIHLTPEAQPAEALGRGGPREQPPAPEGPPIPPGGVFRMWMPKPTVAASPITFYVQATTTEFGESRSAEIQAKVVESESDCEGKVAPFGVPPEGLTFFSAATGAVAVPAGFAAGGLLLGAGAIALIVAAGGAIAAGVAVATGGTPTPTPEPPPTTTTTTTTTLFVRPTPEPTPEPTPAPRCCPEDCITAGVPPCTEDCPRPGAPPCPPLG